MRKLSFIGKTFFISSILLYAAVGKSFSSTSPLKVQAAISLNDDIAQLKSLSVSKNLEMFHTVADKLQKKWANQNQESYEEITVEICNDLTSYDFGLSNYEKQRILTESYAEAALATSKDMSLGRRTFFVRHLHYVPSSEATSITGETWSNLRRRRATLWLSTWQELNSASDAPVNSNVRLIAPNVPDRKYLLTRRLIINGHINPNEIADPQIREKYKADLETYNKATEKFNEQHDYQQIKEGYFPAAARFIIAAYSSTPYNTDELRQYLDKYITDPETKTNILNAVAKNIANSEKANAH